MTGENGYDHKNYNLLSYWGIWRMLSTNCTYCPVMGTLGEEWRRDCRHLLFLLNSHGGTAFGVDQRPRFFSRASASSSRHS